MSIDLNLDDMLGGIRKVLGKGTDDPDAVRFHLPSSDSSAPPAGDGAYTQVTWGQVLGRCREVALYLRAHGIDKDGKVAVFANNRIEWAYVVPGIEGARGVFVPVYFSNTADQTHFVIDHSDAEIVFTEMALLPKLLGRWRDYAKVREVVVWDLEDDGQLELAVTQANENNTTKLVLSDVTAKVVRMADLYAEGAALHAADPAKLPRMLDEMDVEDLAYIIYTSGTTGEPKGVMLSVKNLVATTVSWHKVLQHAFPPRGQRRDIIWMPLSHLGGLGILGTGTINDYESWFADPWTVLQLIPEIKPTFLFCVPAYWEKLYNVALNASDKPAEQYAKLREITGGKLTFLLSGGAGLKKEIKEFFKAAGIQMIEGYGLTECSPNVTMNRLDDYNFDSIGKPMPDVQVKIADDGEICVKGDNVFVGYYKKPQETAACFDEQGWFLTGDLGEWIDGVEGGFIKFKGRKKEIIVTAGGKNVGPGGIEALFAGNLLVEHVAVYGDDKKYLVAMITLNEQVLMPWAQQMKLPYTDFGTAAKSPEVRAVVQAAVDDVNSRLASYETIKKFFIHDGHFSIEQGEITPSMKLRRARVWEAYRDRFEALYA